MAPAVFKTVYLFLALVALPQVLAGPACARDNYGRSDCVKKCKNHWGYKGHYMGQSKWGSVISSSDSQSDPDNILSTACGSNIPATPNPAATPTNSSSPTDGHIPTPSVPNSEAPPHSTPNNNNPKSPGTPSTPLPTSSPAPPPATPATPTSSPPSHSHSPLPPPSSSSSPPPSSPPPPTTTDKKSSPSPTPTNVSNPNQGGSVTTVTNSIEEEALNDHNSYRALHGASPLTWNNDLATYANNWGSKCKFVHSGGPNGENLAAGTGQFTTTDGINMWTGESGDYNPNNPTYSHFTQVVWKSTTELGCALVTCPAGTIFDQSYGPSEFLVCEYSPPGNVDGEYAQNVQP